MNSILYLCTYLFLLFKVENILINSENGFLLCDFGSATRQILQGSIDGISRIEDEIQKYTTLSYRAPEMVDLYLDYPINFKADIWVCILFSTFILQ